MAERLTNYIPISRKLFEHVFFSEQRVFSKFEAWVDLLQEARYDTKEGSRLIGGKVIKIKRGEIPASLRYLAERWDWSKNKVDSFIKLLESEGMITKRTATGTTQTIITICKYNDYNALITQEGTVNGTFKGQCRDSVGTVPGQNSNIVNKENKDKEGEEEPNSSFSPVLDLFLEKDLEGCLETYFSSTTYSRAIEILIMNYSVEAKSVEELRGLAENFNSHCSLEGKIRRSTDEWAKHFKNWLTDPKRKAKQSSHVQQSAETYTQKREKLIKQQQERIRGNR